VRRPDRDQRVHAPRERCSRNPVGQPAPLVVPISGGTGIYRRTHGTITARNVGNNTDTSPSGSRTNACESALAGTHGGDRAVKTTEQDSTVDGVQCAATLYRPDPQADVSAHHPATPTQLPTNQG
jgi:hypothetical protein